METAKPITASIEDYLKTVYLLQKQQGCARLADIADRMQVSRPSANHAVAQLADKGLAEHEKFGPIRLTAKGKQTAEHLLTKFEIIKQFYMHVLHLSEDLASAEACAIEHTIYTATLEKMAAML